jgi:hypothetical protein
LFIRDDEAKLAGFVVLSSPSIDRPTFRAKERAPTLP